MKHGAVLAVLLLAGAGIDARPSGREPARLILHDWFGDSPVATPSYIREHLAFLETQPLDGIAVYVRTADLSLNVTASVMTNTPLDPEGVRRALAPLKGLPFKTLAHNLAAVLGGSPPDFFDDWSIPIRNFAILARAARDAGLKGLYFDNENYSSRWGDYPKGVSHPEKTLAQYQAQTRRRGKEIMEAMVAEFPDIVVLTLHGPYVSEPKAPAPLFPQWHSRNELLGPFFAGFVEGAGPKALCVDGGELYHLRSAEEFEKSYEWRSKSLASDPVDCAFIPASLRAAWPARVSVGFGLYNRSFGGRDMDPAILRSTMAHALRRADRYVWLYLEKTTFLKPADRGGAPEPWVTAVRQAREDAARRRDP